jgi:hypothetical protein
MVSHPSAKGAEYIIEYHARLAGEAAYLAGCSCDLGQCEARCVEPLRLAAQEPARGYRIYESFVRGFNEMADCLERNGFTLADVKGL